MTRHFLVTLALTLTPALSACGELDAFDDALDGETGEADEDLEQEPPTAIGVLGENSDELAPGPDAADPDGSITPPEGGDDDGRITFVGEEDGDLIFHATLGPAVAAAFPNADHHTVRLSGDRTEILWTVVDASGETVYHAGKLAAADGSIEVRFPSLFDITQWPDNCTFPPCPWDDDWPPVDADDGVMTIVGGPDTTVVRGMVEGAPFGFDLIEVDGQVQKVDVTGPDFDESYAGRVEVLRMILRDFTLAMPELGELVDWCDTVAGLIVSDAISCHEGDLEACADLFDDYFGWNYRECE